MTAGNSVILRCGKVLSGLSTASRCLIPNSFAAANIGKESSTNKVRSGLGLPFFDQGCSCRQRLADMYHFSVHLQGEDAKFHDC